MSQTSDIDLIQRHLFRVRGRLIMLDSDLAEIYGVTTKALNQAVTRNAARFPEDFAFVVEGEDLVRLKSQIVTSKTGRGGTRKPPRAFTEHGALMASTILRTERAVTMSVFVIRAFVQMRDALSANEAILKRLAEIDNGLLLHDSALRDIYQKLMPMLAPPADPPRPRIGFHPDSK